MENNKIRFLGMHKKSHKHWLDTLSQSNYLDENIDTYNQGPLIEKLENKVAKLLGKEDALFFHKGTIAQLTALKVAAEKSNCHTTILHPKSHIVFDEQDAYKYVTGLNGILIGSPDKPFAHEDLININEKVGSLVVELPLRRSGFILTDWDELIHIKKWCQDQNCHFHMDGARLWESAHFYKRSLSEISNLFDSVYVSLYKGIGAIGGSILAGDKGFIEECKVWRSRLGGDAWTQFPSVITALDGLENTLPEIDSWVKRAHEVANKISKTPQIKVNKPQTNGFLIYIEGDLEELNSIADSLTDTLGIRLFNSFFKTKNPNIQAAEVQIGQDSNLISNSEINTYFSKLVNGKISQIK
jgi:threonine aldolase